MMSANINLGTEMTIAPTSQRRPLTGRAVAPHKLAHVVFRVRRYDDCIAWYERVLNARVVFRNAMLAFLSYDEEHHRVALVHLPPGDDQIPGAPGLEHVAFTYASLGDLLDNYLRLRDIGIDPYWTINHGPTISMYYRDPDGNQIELQYDCYPDPDDLLAYFSGGEVRENPIGIDVDPDALVARWETGEPLSSLIVRDPGRRGSS